MPISRFLFLSSKRHSGESLNLFRRFGPCKRIQSRNYVNSSNHANGKPGGDRVMNVDSQASRTWGTYVIPAALLGFVGLAGLAHYNDERRAIPKGQGTSSSGTTAKGPIIGGPFSLIDTQNQTVTERNFLGKWVLLYFGYTFSPDVGPEQIQIIAKAIDKLESKHNVKVLPVFVTIDPQRDTPSQLQAYLKEFDSRIIGLTGPVSAVRQLAQEYRVFFRKIEEDKDDYLVECSHNMYLLNPNMEVAGVFGVEYDADDLSDAILKELKRTQN
ncbi:hypothetical protein F8388_020159 [Cannabis sativa]|uniref:Uncharacterized protein n=1 Tax=Cannabis sativa TaxID=3483 RepID=A0A7J6HZA4_CANSA|nr:hypothetical protein F8388_020159 [Cannabis sativa]KAF4400486.1 hypothetical protein G4B88_023279 [Cannabis sativa]